MMKKNNNIKMKHSILLIVAKQLCICIPLHFWSAWVAEQPKKKKKVVCLIVLLTC